MPKIFVTRPIPDKGIKLLKDKGFNVVVNEAAEDRPATKEEVKEGIREADALLSVLTEKIDAEIMDAGLPTLKIIANYAVGFDNIDTDAAKEKNIMVTNTAGVISNTVAEFTFCLILSRAHRVVEGDRFTREDKYKAWGPKLLLGTDIEGKTLGLVGSGKIGSLVASKAVKGFNMKVLYNDIKRNENLESEFGAKFVENLDDLLGQSDFITLHVPLLDSTKHLINEDNLKKMKKTAYLINTSRGPVIDEKALARALKENWIQGASLDVYEFEPDITAELKELENVIITPHIASATLESRQGMSEVAATNIIEVLEGRTPPNLIS